MNQTTKPLCWSKEDNAAWSHVPDTLKKMNMMSRDGKQVCGSLEVGVRGDVTGRGSTESSGDRNVQHLYFGDDYMNTHIC